MTKEELFEQILKLTESQRNQITREVVDYISMNGQLKSTTPDICPYCEKKLVLLKEDSQKIISKDINVKNVVINLYMIHIQLLHV